MSLSLYEGIKCLVNCINLPLEAERGLALWWIALEHIHRNPITHKWTWREVALEHLDLFSLLSHCHFYPGNGGWKGSLRSLCSPTSLKLLFFFLSVLLSYYFDTISQAQRCWWRGSHEAVWFIFTLGWPRWSHSPPRPGASGDMAKLV